jgi:hypothetical protein
MHDENTPAPADADAPKEQAWDVVVPSPTYFRYKVPAASFKDAVEKIKNHSPDVEEIEHWDGEMDYANAEEHGVAD